MKRHRSVRVIVFLAIMAVFSVFFAGQRELQAYSAVETLDLNTHGLMLRSAREQLSNNPVFKQSRFLSIERILQSEGVFKDIPWDPFPTQGGGPDVDGRSRYSEHYYNPRIKKGGAPAAVGKYYSILVQSMQSGKEGPAEQGAAWSAHFLADMCLPHHIVGIPAEEAEAIYIGGIDGRSPWNLTPDESGPLWLGETPLSQSNLWNTFLRDLYGKWPEWGTTQDFKRTIEAFHSLGSGGKSGFRDWFDPWYYNGWGVGVDPFQIAPVVHNSSHAKWEVWAHLELTRGANPYRPTIYERFHPQWENGWLSFDQKVPWRVQQAKAEEFAKKAAQSTYDDMKRIYRDPRIGVDDAIWRIMTLWRASISAMKPSMEVKKDVTDPSKYELKAIVGNIEKENVFDVKVRITLGGDGSTFSEVKEIKGGIQANGKGEAVFTIGPKDPEKCKVSLEVIGHYEKTPDLQYAKVEEPLKGIKKSQDEAQNEKLREILNALRQAAERAEKLASEITAVCRSVSDDIRGAQADVEKIKSRVESIEKQVRSLETVAEDVRRRAESIRQYHLDAEQGAANEGEIAHRAEELSKTLCEATKAIQNVKTKDERRQLFAGMESTKDDLKAFLSEGNSILERVRQNVRSAQTTLSEIEALTRDLLATSRQSDLRQQVTPEMLDKKLTGIMERIRSAREKVKELAGIEADAGKRYEEGKKIIGSWQATLEKDRISSEMEGYMGRIDKARRQVDDCPEKALADAESALRDTAPVKEAYIKAEEALADARSRMGVDEETVKKARETAGLTKYLAQMTAAYMERIRRACTDGAFCFTLAQDIMKRPIYVVVPDVRGMHVDGAGSTLKKKGFNVHPSIIGAASKIGSEFKVQSQSPAAESKAEEESTVTVYYYGQFNTQDAVANADCSRWPGSVAKWDAGKKRAVCICSEGASWNKTRTSCVDNRQLAMDNINCSRYPGAVAVFDERANRAVCECGQGLKWNKNRTRCVDTETAALETADCSRFPGTRPMWNHQTGRVDCYCPQGAMWDGSKGRCISRQELDDYCNRIGAMLTAAARANDIKRFREILPMAQNCDFYNQALADLQNMEYNQQVAMWNQMMGIIAGGMKPPQQPSHPPSKPPTAGGSSPPKPPVSPVKPPTGGSGAQTGPVKPPSGGGSRVDCDKKYCPICGTDNLDMLMQSVSKQCMDCRRRFKAQIDDCNRGGPAANTPGHTVAQFENHYVLQCVQQRWNAGARRYYAVTVYAVYGPGKQYPSGNCKQVFGPNTESQCSMRAEMLSRGSR